MTLVLTDRIDCIGCDNRAYTVEEWTNMIEFQTIDGRLNRTPGVKELRLSNGDAVNFIDEDTFEIVQSETKIKRRTC